MELTDIQAMIDQYKEALLNEYAASLAANTAQEDADRIEASLLAAAYEDGTINGKNADARKRQEAAFIADSEAIADARRQQVVDATHAASTTIERKAQEALINLTKAWLYSQSGIN